MQERSKNVHHFDLSMRLNSGVIRFSVLKNNHGSSGACASCPKYSLSVKVNTHEMLQGMQGLWVHLFFGFGLVCVVCKKKKTCNLSQWLTTSLHRAVYKLWDLSCISVVYSFTFIVNFHLHTTNLPCAQRVVWMQVYSPLVRHSQSLLPRFLLTQHLGQTSGWHQSLLAHYTMHSSQESDGNLLQTLVHWKNIG